MMSVQPAKPRRRLIWLLAVVASFCLISAWLLASTSGLRLLAAAVSRSGAVSVEGIDGSVLSSPRAQTLIIDIPDLRITARDISLDWRPAALLGGKIEITRLTVRDVEALSLPSPYPDTLRLPLAISLQKLDVGSFRLYSKAGAAADVSASKITARLASDGNLHRLLDMQAVLEYGRLTASGEMDGSRPFAIRAQAELAGLADYTGPDAKEAHISATVSGNLMALAIKATGSGAGLTGAAQMQLTPYAPFPVASLKLQADGLNPRAFSTEAAQANLTLQADLHSNATGALEGNVTLNNLAPAPLNRNGLPLQDAHAHATISPDLLRLDDLTLMLAKNASISGKLAWQHKSGSADLMIRRLDPAAIDTRLRSSRINGTIKLTGDRTAQRGILALSDGTMHLDAHLAKSGDTLTLDDINLNRGPAALTGKGILKLDDKRAYRFDGKLHRFDLAAFILVPHTDLNATLELQGKLKPETSGTLRFTMNNSRFADQPVSGHALIDFVGTDQGHGTAEFRLGDNRLYASGGIGRAADTLQLELAAPALNQLGAGFGGTLNAHASLAGSLARPDASFEAQGQNISLPDEHHLAGFNAKGALHGDALTLAVNADDYRRNENSRLQSLQLNVHGSPANHELNAEVQLNKDSKLVLHASGGFPHSDKGLQDIQWRGALTELSVSGALPFKLQADTPVSLSHDHIVLDTADLTIAGGKLHINGIDWTPQRLISQGNFTGIGLRAGLRSDTTTAHDQGILRLGGEWNLASATQGSLRIERESGDWIFEQPLGLHTLQLTALAAKGRLTSELTAQGAHLGNWHAVASMPLMKSATLFNPSAPLTGRIHIDMSDLAWLGPAISDNLKSGGRLTLDADVSGTPAKPGLNGQVHGEDLSLALLDQGLRLQQGQLAAHFDQDTLRIDSLSFVAPHDPKPKDALLAGVTLGSEPGKLAISGAIGLNGKNGNLAISANRLPLSQRRDRWIIASGNGQMELRQNRLALTGDIRADAGLISQASVAKPELSDDIAIAGQQATVRKGPHLFVDATLNLGEHFYLRTSGLEARLTGQLSLHDAQALRVTGSIAARDATFDAYGQRLSVERGIVNFQGPLYDPGLNILAVRRGLSVEAGVAVTGTALHPSVKLVSTPTVPDVEKLSWIVLGRAPSGSDTSMLLSAAGGILGSGAGGITGQLKQALGVDELSLQQDNSAVSDNPLSSQIVTVGKRLSSRAFISYAQGVTAVAGVTKLTYTLTPRVNIVTQAGVDNAIDVFYTFSFD
jgi:translocation and assembly module TamB